MNKIIRVIIVDDSRLVRSLLKDIINADPALEVVACAADANEARALIKQHNPDVITLDVEMPGMNGIAFLRNLMRLRPMPVLMISSLTQRGSDITLEALELGAVDYVAKLSGEPNVGIEQLADEIVHKIKTCAKVNIHAVEHNAHQCQLGESRLTVPKSKASFRYKVVSIGASTGGTEAIKELLCALPEKMPPIVLVQHLPSAFCANFARRLRSLTCFNVVEVDGQVQKLLTGHVYLSAGDFHIKLTNVNGITGLDIDTGNKVNRHRPSVDVLFKSAAKTLASEAIGVILTGMGMDGAKGLAEMRQAGGYTIAQDKESCVVWGMPRVAVEQGAAIEVCPLTAIAERLVKVCYDQKTT